jgi:subtilisin-like proprotein convertase family protein
MRRRALSVIAGCTLFSLALMAPGAGASEFTHSTFSSPGPIAVPPSGNLGVASPYPSAISVKAPGLVGRVKATVAGITHNATIDLEVLLVSPDGANTILMSDTCGDSDGLVPRTFTFDDAAAQPLPAPPGGPVCNSTTAAFKPADYAVGPTMTDSFPLPAPSGPWPVRMSALIGHAASGTWRLFVVDDQDNGEAGSFARGWNVELTAGTCAGKPVSTDGNVTVLGQNLGTEGNDFLTGTPDADVIVGGPGNDTINGMGGKDVVCGGPGSDRIRGDAGKDRLLGEGGKDKLIGGGGKDNCIGGKGKDAGKCEKSKSF